MRGVAALTVLAMIGGAAVGSRSLPGPARFALGTVGLFVVVAGFWTWGGRGGPHLVYALRDSAGRLKYVGSTLNRIDSDASLEQRLIEHLDDAEVRPWKHEIAWENCTVARRCWTKPGARFSEKRRIETFAFLGRFQLFHAPAIENKTYTSKRKTRLLSACWYAVESRVVPEACWHRPLVLADTPTPRVASPVSVEPEPELVEDDVFAETARRVRQRAQRPAEPVVSELDDETVDAEFRRLTDGWLSDEDGDGWPGGVDEGGSSDVASDVDGLAPPYGGAGLVDGDRDIATPGPRDIDPGQPAAGLGETCQVGPETVENAATPSDGGAAGTDVASGGADGPAGASGGGRDVAKSCRVEGCGEHVAKYGRCATHARQWDAERQRRRRQKDGGDE